MNDETILEKLDTIINGQHALNLEMQGLKKDFDNNSKVVNERFTRIEKELSDGAESRKRIHERIDSIDKRVLDVEKNPVFSEWAAIKGRLFTLLWGVLILVGGGIILTALPKIIEMVK